jgi:hypothetical protein
MRKKCALLFGFMGLVVLLVGCEQPAAIPTFTSAGTTDVLFPTATGTPTVEPTATAVPTLTIEPSPEPTATTEPTATPTPDGSQFWVEMQDPHYGVRFAVPCYWEVNFPAEYPESGSGISYSIRNYSDEYTLSFPRGTGLFEAGGIKIDMSFMNGPLWGADAGTSLSGFVTALYGGVPDINVLETEELTINDQRALRVTTEGTFGTGQFYLFAVSDEVYLLFGPNPEAVDDPDVLGILNSIAVTPDVAVAIPDAVPEDPPQGLLAPCMGITELPPNPGALPEGCKALSFATVDELRSGLEAYLSAANTGGLAYEYVNEPFAVGLWQSEGQEMSRNEFFGRLANSYYRFQAESIAEGKPSQLTFTTDRDQFPPLMDMPVEGMVGPDVNIADVIYSEGWGQDGKGAALIFLAEDDCGKYYWHGLIFSEGHFDK